MGEAPQQWNGLMLNLNYVILSAWCVLTITASVTTNEISVSFDALINCFVLIYVSGLVALPK